MYSIIDEKIDLILANPLLKKDIPDYLGLLERFKEKDVSHNTQFQRTSRKYWAMNAARLDDAFYTTYFDLLEISRQKDELNVENIAETLYRAHREKGLNFPSPASWSI